MFYWERLDWLVSFVHFILKGVDAITFTGCFKNLRPRFFRRTLLCVFSSPLATSQPEVMLLGCSSSSAAAAWLHSCSFTAATRGEMSHRSHPLLPESPLLLPSVRERQMTCSWSWSGCWPTCASTRLWVHHWSPTQPVSSFWWRHWVSRAAEELIF